MVRLPPKWVVHVDLEEGNGRIARLMVNFILARHGYPMIVARDDNGSWRVFITPSL